MSFTKVLVYEYFDKSIRQLHLLHRLHSINYCP